MAELAQQQACEKFEQMSDKGKEAKSGYANQLKRLVPHCANHTIPPFWLDDRPPLLQQVGVRPAASWSVLALCGL
ncbi:hypothetical protein ANN_11921 [Periplaneta americana]|uniref:Uncharacterized protein n=1 Tax=Periplaneta americana TaxID=6978 RepID=A0ABQ8T857_PERAM|nr:hypothetical protein ANN_11921 [Periplaneta americana]